MPVGATPKRAAFAHSLAIARDRTRCRYLARFLLNYDPSARAYWAASGASLALLPVPGSDVGGDAGGGGGGAASGAASTAGAATDAASRVQRLREEQVREDVRSTASVWFGLRWRVRFGHLRWRV